jgi:carboxylesterase type B
MNRYDDRMEDEACAPADPDIRATRHGLVQGLRTGGIVRFLGVPYAAPPERFAPPRPPDAWDGPRDATAPGDCALHRIARFPGIDVEPLVGPGGLGGRDYLTLNVWTPEAAAGRPVMVFIHGGGFVIGSKDAAVHDGSGFARSGLVCVAINYRLGIDGFLPVPGAPTNLGLRDMLLALRWVLELAFVFDRLATISGARGLAGAAPPQELADRTHALWVGFAAHGVLPWAQFDARDRHVYRLAQGVVEAEQPLPATCPNDRGRWSGARTCPRSADEGALDHEVARRGVRAFAETRSFELRL